jgi:hypothetical protein
MGVRRTAASFQTSIMLPALGGESRRGRATWNQVPPVSPPIQASSASSRSVTVRRLIHQLRACAEQVLPQVADGRRPGT